MFLEENPSETEEWEEKRSVGTTLHSRRLQGRNFDPKSSKTCKKGMREINFPSNQYPSSGEPILKNAIAYGFKIINDCGDYNFGEQKFQKGEYDTEHVLEWSLVSGFFDEMHMHPDFKDGIDNPDPEVEHVRKNPKDAKSTMVKQKLPFCDYWSDTWDSKVDSDEYTISNPDPSVIQDSRMKKPLRWLAEAYPFVKGKSAKAERAHEAEFVLLQRKINSETKTKIFQINPNNKIYLDDGMKTLIMRTNNEKKQNRSKGAKFPNPFEQPRVAIQRIRAVVGFYLYMNEKKIDDILVAQVDRIGAQLENIEKALSNNPRIVKRNRKNPTTNEDEEYTVNFDKWQNLKLKEKWFEFMDRTYTNANKRGREFMKTNIKNLKEERRKKEGPVAGREKATRGHEGLHLKSRGCMGQSRWLVQAKVEFREIPSVSFAIPLAISIAKTVTVAFTFTFTFTFTETLTLSLTETLAISLTVSFAKTVTISFAKTVTISFAKTITISFSKTVTISFSKTFSVAKALAFSATKSFTVSLTETFAISSSKSCSFASQTYTW
ncbi:hypothetical protein B0J11DRAFT_503048 [Dendryphion nanum]|uniref:Uncharacterized protein n=1 Tax=Dendryphion nanum TaxID=256645 RepID=A0A9P9E6K1_9PLEO|nr:hypothetical protein B0J11DRAFT_503048 [Dendryphion nanum]